MKILVLKVTIRASWVHSLKDKRMVLLSITKRIANKFNVSVGEVASQDEHKLIVIGISAVGTSGKVLSATKESIINFIEENTDGEIIDIEEDLIQY